MSEQSGDMYFVVASENVSMKCLFSICVNPESIYSFTNTFEESFSPQNIEKKYKMR